MFKMGGMEMKGKKIYRILQFFTTLAIMYMTFISIFLAFGVFVKPKWFTMSPSLGGLAIEARNFQPPLWMAIFMLIIMGLNIFLLCQIRAFFRNLVRNQFFIIENAHYMRNVGFIFLILCVLENIHYNEISKMMFLFFKQEPEGVINKLITKQYFIFPKESWVTSLENGQLLYSLHLNMGLFFAGIALLLLSKIFKYAVQIAEENKLTV